MKLREVIRIEEKNGRGRIERDVCMKMYNEPNCYMYTIVNHPDKDYIGCTLVMPASELRRDYTKMVGTSKGRVCYYKINEDSFDSVCE